MCGSYIESARMCVVESGMKKFRRFLRSMFYIGCIGFGGGSALIPIIEQEIAEKQGLDAKQNIDKDVVVASITHEGKLLPQKYVIAGNHFSNVFIYQ